MKRLSLGLFGLTLSFVFVTGINAAEQEEQEAVIVTATRTAQTADESLASVNVITRDDIEQSQARDVMQLLNLQVGIDVARTGGPGQATSLYMRGTNSNQTLVLIDGVRAASANTGSFAWQHLSLTDIERIEIVRGPRGSLYGSDAIGGVIQIFTRKNKGMHVRGQVGSYNSKLAEAGIGGGDKVKYSLNVAAQETEGFSATNSNSSFFNPDNDGYRNGSASGRITIPLTQHTDLRFSAWYADGETEYDEGVQESVNGIFDARLVSQTTANWEQTLSAGLSKDDSEFVSAFPSIFNTERFMADWQHNFTLALNHLLTAGLSTVEDQATNIDLLTDTTVYDESIRNNAAFIALQSQVGQHNFNLSGRVDDYENFGNHSTGNIAWGYDLKSALRLTASYGSGFRAPSLNELFSPGYFGFYTGNPDLQPETSRTLEFGLRYKSDPNQQLRISIYRNDIENLIANEGINFQAINIDEAQIDGLELEYAYSQPKWSLLANLTLQNAIDTSDNSKLIRRPDEKFSLQLHRTLTDEGSVGLEWVYVGERLDGLAKDQVLDPYHLLNLSGVVKMAKSLWLEARIDNLFDEDYELVYGYNTPGLSVFVGVNYKLPE
jgi:vitamin B12 transporter